jgi:hypothetical protein
MPLTGNVASAQHHPARITQPHVREGELDCGPARRGAATSRSHRCPGRPAPPTFRGAAPDPAC